MLGTVRYRWMTTDELTQLQSSSSVPSEFIIEVFYLVYIPNDSCFSDFCAQALMARVKEAEKGGDEYLNYPDTEATDPKIRRSFSLTPVAICPDLNSLCLISSTTTGCYHDRRLASASILLLTMTKRGSSIG